MLEKVPNHNWVTGAHDFSCSAWVDMILLYIYI